jgi:hypothetical protein
MLPNSVYAMTVRGSDPSAWAAVSTTVPGQSSPAPQGLLLAVPIGQEDGTRRDDGSVVEMSPLRAALTRWHRWPG